MPEWKDHLRSRFKISEDDFNQALANWEGRSEVTKAKERLDNIGSSILRENVLEDARNIQSDPKNFDKLKRAISFRWHPDKHGEKDYGVFKPLINTLEEVFKKEIPLTESDTSLDTDFSYEKGAADASIISETRATMEEVLSGETFGTSSPYPA